MPSASWHLALIVQPPSLGDLGSSAMMQSDCKKVRSAWADPASTPENALISAVAGSGTLAAAANTAVVTVSTVV